MRGLVGPALASAAVMVMLAPAAAQLSQKWAWCVNQGGTFSADQRINGCSSIIQSGRETPRKLAIAYYSRGLAYYDKGDDDRAITEYNEAIRLDPQFAPAYSSRGLAYDHKGDLGRADPDYNEAIRLDPKYAQAFFNRGVANLSADKLPQALADLIQSSDLNPRYAYAALWLHIADTRSNLPSQLAEAAKQIDMTKWPAPIIRLFLGQTTTQALFATADDTDAKTKQRKTCEVNFYSAELALQRRAKDEATRLFRLAAAECPESFTEYAAALAELKALGASP